MAALLTRMRVRIFHLFRFAVVLCKQIQTHIGKWHSGMLYIRCIAYRFSFLKFFHESNQFFYAFDGHCIVNAGTHTAYSTVAFQVYKSCFCGCLDKFCIQLFVAGYKRNVHQRTVFFTTVPWNSWLSSRIIIENGCFFLIVCFHGFQAAHFLQPFEDLAAHVNAVAVRCVVQGSCICMGLDTSAWWAYTGSTSSVIRSSRIMDNNHTGRSDVFLHAAVDHAIFGHIHRLGQETGRNIRHQGLSFGVRQCLKFGSVNGIVLADIYIVCIRADRQI